MNTFYHVGREGEDGDNETEEGLRRKMEKEFRIGAVGAADSCGESSRANIADCDHRDPVRLAHFHADGKGTMQRASGSRTDNVSRSVVPREGIALHACHCISSHGPRSIWDYCL